jgi:nickel-dependent lactate racemase
VKTGNYSRGSTSENIDRAELQSALDTIVGGWLADDQVGRILLVPPDHTRLHSQAGAITEYLWKRFGETVQVDIMPALGTHKAMNAEECRLMFGAIPHGELIEHRWREELVQLGEVSSEEMSQLSGGRFCEPMQVELNQRLVSGDYDLIISIGQVVPHEVIGFANYTKNICIGVGGSGMIHKSHFLGAVCGMESMMGRADTPVRRAIDGAFERFVKPHANVKFLLTVVEECDGVQTLRGLYAGQDRQCFEEAAALSQAVNVTLLDEPLERAVVYLDPSEFASTWLGNKAIYRTRMAMADEGELIVLAPAVQMFGEDATIDQLVRKHGYCGTPATLAAVKSDPELAANLSAAAHLIHGSSEGRFSITYCVPDEMGQAAIEAAGFQYRSFADAITEFPIEGLADGWQKTAAGKPFYFIRNPALGLWATRSRFDSSGN